MDLELREVDPKEVGKRTKKAKAEESELSKESWYLSPKDVEELQEGREQ
jgi:hypothetical protein